MGVYRQPLPGPYTGSQPWGEPPPDDLIQPASGNLSVSPGVSAITITGYAPAIAQTGIRSVSPAAAGITVTGYAPTIVRTGAGTIIVGPLKNNTGTVWASQTGIIVNVYNSTTGAFVVQKTGVATDVSGFLSINDGALAVGTTYAYEVVLTTARILPLAVAA